MMASITNLKRWIRGVANDSLANTKPTKECLYIVAQPIGTANGSLKD